MEVFKEGLVQHPWLGMITSIVGAALPFVAWITPYLQLAGLIIGLLVGLLTLISLLEERIHKKKHRHHDFFKRHKHLK